MTSALYHAVSLLNTSGVEEAQKPPCVGGFVPLCGELLHIIYASSIPRVGIL